MFNQWFLFGLVTCFIGLVTSLTQKDEAQIDAFMEEVMDCMEIPGMSLAAVQDNEIVIAKGYGKANIEEDIDVDANTLFNVASVSKAFTAFLVALQLSDDTNGYSWNTPVRDILGESFHLFNGYYSNHTTMRDMLGHKMGIPRDEFTWTMDPFSREELVERVRFIEPIYPFRTTWTYNNLMYMTAGYASGIIAGSSYEDAMKERVFDPIGMNSSMFMQDVPSDYEGFAVPYFPVDPDGPLIAAPADFYNIFRSVGPAGSVVASANGMALWIQFLLNDATTQDGEVLLSPEEFQYYMTPEISTGQSISFPPEFPEIPDSFKMLEKYGKGWMKGFYKGYNLVWHPGGMPGHISNVYLLPDLNIGSFMSINTWDNSLTHIMLPFVNDILMGDEPWLTSEAICSAVPELKMKYRPSDFFEGFPTKESLSLDNIIELRSKQATKGQPKQVEEYAGVYGNFLFGNLTINFLPEEEELELVWGNHGHYQLVPTEVQDIFLLIGKNTSSAIISWLFYFRLAVFESSQGDGVIDRLQLHLTDLEAPPIFIRDLNMADAPPPDISSCN